MAALVAVVLAIAPAVWLADMLDVAGQDATTFLLRRYAASATAALAVVAIATVWRTDPWRAVLLLHRCCGSYRGIRQPFRRRPAT